MARDIEKYSKRGLQTGDFSAIIGISLVLFMLGLVLGAYFGLEHLQKAAKEDIEIDLFFNPDLNESDIKLIEQETYLACVSLYTKNAHEVITNSTCLNSFSRFGHPNLKETAAFKELLATLDSYEPDLGWASVLPLARSLLE